MRKSPLIIIFLFIIISKANAQSFCGSDLNIDRALQISDKLNNSSRTYNGTRPMIRLVLHRITKADGTGGFTWNEIRAWVSTLPNVYADHNICFTVIKENDIANNNFYNLTGFSGTIWGTMIGTDRVDNAINIYFVEGADAGGRASGFLFNSATSFPTVSISRKVNTPNGLLGILNTFILAHEIGHCLGLLHTHETALCTENIQRTGQNVNCSGCGDELCDTPADHGLGISTNNVNDATCVYIGGQTQGGFTYTPDTRNVMSYTRPGCMLWFTEGQANRMRNFILNSNTFDDFVIPFNRNVTDAFSNDSKYFSVQNNIESTSSISGGSITFEAGNTIVLNPGFETSNNAYFEAKILQYSCIEPLVTNSAKKDDEASSDFKVGIKYFGYSLFPNPANSVITIRNEGDISNLTQIDGIYDCAGRIVTETDNISFDFEAGVNISHLPSGFYLLKVYTQGVSKTIPFSKTNF